jgi:hypothetical protein
MSEFESRWREFVSTKFDIAQVLGRTESERSDVRLLRQGA